MGPTSSLVGGAHSFDDLSLEPAPGRPSPVISSGRVSPSRSSGGPVLRGAPIDYVGSLRRGAPWAIAFALLAGVIGLLVPIHQHPPPKLKGGLLAPMYQATVVVGPSGSALTTTDSPTQVANLVHSAPVARAAAAATALPARYVPAISKNTTITAIQIGTTVEGQISSEAATKHLAMSLANATARALIAQLNQQTVRARTNQLTSDQRQLTYLEGQVKTLESEAAAAKASKSPTAGTLSPAVLEAQASSVSAAYTTDYEAYLNLESQPAPTAGVALLTPASSAKYVGPSDHQSIFTERRVRGPVGFVVGLCLAVLALLVLAQVDRRIRRLSVAEAAFGLPVLVEVPMQRLRRGPADVVVRSDPGSAAAEAYRTLRWAVTSRFGPGPVAPPASSDLAPHQAVLFTPETGNDADSADRLVIGQRQSTVIAVVSPSAEPTRRVVVANLAAAAAESGRSVLVLVSESPDGMRKGQHWVGSQPNVDGDVQAPSLAQMARETTVPGVMRADFGAGPLGRVPDEFLPGLVEEARESADMVVLDVGGALTSHWAVSIGTAADGMVMVGEAGWTTTDQAARATTLLSQLNAPLLGVVLTQAPSAVPRKTRRQPRPVLAEAINLGA